MSMMAITAARAAAAYAPPYRSRLALWLDLTSPDTSIVSGAVAVLGDRSGNARHFTQGTGTKRPAYTASDADFGGRPSMSFDGVDDFLNRSGLPAWPQLTVAFVARGGVATRRYMNYGGGSGGEVLIQNDSSTAARAVYFNSNTTSKFWPITAGATRRITASFDSGVGAAAVPDVYLNGVDTAASYALTLASNGPMAGSRTMSVGSNAAGTSAFFDGKIGNHFLVYNAALTGAEMAVVAAWQESKSL